MTLPASELLTVDELATALKRPKATIYYWSSQLQGFPKIVTGRQIRFELPRVLEFFDSQKREKTPTCNPVVEALRRRIINRSLKTKTLVVPISPKGK